MSDPHRIDRLIAAAYDDLWAIQPAKLAAIKTLLTIRGSGQRLDRDEIRAAINTAIAAPPVRQAARGVAVVPVRGVLAPRMNLVLEASGGTSTEQLVSDARALVADPQVTAVVFAFDSPGGSCTGLPEAATALRALRGSKPIIGVASYLSASAAFVLLAQCDRVIASPSADVGALGVLTLHEDLSGLQEKAGIRTTVIAAGKYKAETSPFAPLSADAFAALQKRVNTTNAQLVAHVAAGRNVTEAHVRSGYGEGRLVSARDALAVGMVDEIGTLDDVIGELAEKTTPSVRVTRVSRDAARRQEPAAMDDWDRNVTLSLRLLDL